jgi:predicted acyltransferase
LTQSLEGLSLLREGDQELDGSSSHDRVISIDCLRGFIVSSMVLVNNPGNPDYVYSQLSHVDWHGMTFADIIAPWFLWIIGVTTAISLSRRMKTMSRVAVFGHVIRRAIVLYVIGILLTAWPAFVPGSGSSVSESIKVMGILQRIAICYLLGSALFLVATFSARAILAVLLLVGYWFPGPADGTGPFEMGGNRAYLLDRQLLGDLGETSSHSLLTVPTVIFTILSGALAGDLIRRKGKVLRNCVWLLASGVVMCAVAMLVSQWIPINRRLWTPSFALLTSGMAAVALSTIYWVLEVLRLRMGTGWLVAYGANPIFLFVLSELGRMIGGMKGITDSTGGWQSYWMVGYKIFLSIGDPKAASALFALTYMLILGLIAEAMYRRGWIVKV